MYFGRLFTPSQQDMQEAGSNIVGIFLTSDLFFSNYYISYTRDIAENIYPWASSSSSQLSLVTFLV